MKTSSFYKLITLVLIVLAMGACDNNDASMSEEDRYLAKLTGTWKITDASVDELHVTEAFTGMTLAFDGKNYQVTGAVEPIWHERGSFTLQKVGGAQPFNLLSDDDVVITVSELSANTLALNFQYAGVENGRASSVSGNYTFRFIK